LSVELPALHAATKNIINLTARTGGLYAGGGRPVPLPPHTADVAFRVAPRQSTFGGHTVSRQRSSSTRRGSMQHARSVLKGF